MSTPDFRTTRLRDWLDRGRAGDRAARNELVSAASSRLEHLARRMLRGYPAVRRWAETGDVLQAAAVRLLRALDTVPVADTREFMNLAAAVIRRELIDLARHFRGPHGGGTCDVGHAPLSDVVAPADELDDWTALHEAVEALPAELREVFGLTFYHGRRPEEVAELFGVHVRTIRRRRLAALTALRGALGDRVPAAGTDRGGGSS